MAPSRAPAEVLKAHTYDSGCRLAPLKYPFTSSELDGIPPVKAQFFYTSIVPIDDPLSTSTIAASTDAHAAKGITQPFSEGDNNELERAWLGLATDDFRRNHAFARRGRSPSPSLAQVNAKKLEAIIHELAVKHVDIHASEGAAQEFMETGFDDPVDQDESEVRCCADLVSDVGIALRSSFCAVSRRHQVDLDRENVTRRVMAEIKRLGESLIGQEQRRDPSVAASVRLVGAINVKSMAAEGRSSSRPASRRDSRSLPQAVPNAQVAPIDTSVATSSLARTSAADDGLTGMPFVRVGTPDSHTFSPGTSLPRATGAIFSDKQAEDQPRRGRLRSNTAQKRKTSREASRKLQPPSSGIAEHEARSGTASVPVGVSRLHEVTLPALQMKPIYWSPVNDISTVLRATWFYKDDMRPVDIAVANQLEAGYRELKPHAQTWQDELRSAVDVGPAGEEKVSHPLWPPIPKAANKQPAKIPEAAISHDPFCAGRCFRGEAAAEGSRVEDAHEDSAAGTTRARKFDQYHVIYKDETTAYLLKPSLKPSAYYGRRPVAKIMKGFPLGIAVVRGFDPEVWAKKHQKKSKQQAKTAPNVFSLSQSLRETRQDGCSACRAADERGQVTDLVLVAHGIGQKLAERVETYHFTHAINAFRRAINVELGSEEIKSVLRDGQNGIMVLPVNWRQNLSFEDGGPMTADDKDAYAPESFGLRDIEPKTIPAVRGMISDVMFDIPFYMSHHKPKMVAALVSEANRVYRLWCRNNQGFARNGRVHILAHSLGSVMTLEVLSRQPTSISVLDLNKPAEVDHFEFDTKNLFFIGSPSAFFLLLERGALMPRRNRWKPGVDPTVVQPDEIVGESGAFGCIAVDNIYNILAREDAVAYLLNGTVDPAYAASLKTAYVPSATTGFFQSVGNAMWSMVPGMSSSATKDKPTNPAAEEDQRPPPLRLPSQLELEVHDFTREEMAEQKAYLLNDNGQIDYFIRSGGGPLEIQYLNMLSAHSSYWYNTDLIRMLCMEIGRKPGRKNTLPAMRAVKNAKRVI